ncbi:MAG: hydrogenase maturation protease [Pseudohongiellaceae bacterium]
MGLDTRILGVGNSYRGDDGVGPWVIAALRQRLPRASLAVSDGEMSNLLAEFGGCQALLLIDALDAATAGVDAGTVVRLDGRDAKLEATGLRASTHAMGVAEAVSMAKALDCLPGDFSVIGIAGTCFENREGLSRPVRDAAAALVEELMRELEHA